jgi:hypothetical protein
MISELANKLPPHDGLGDIVIQDPDEDGYILFYRPCLYRLDKEEIKAYEAENDSSYFGWCVKGANHIYGAMAWMKESDE